MRILPVIDLMNDVVVRGVGGRRHEYRPIVSRLTRSVQPLDVAQAFRDRFGLNELYLADLDAIAGKPPAAAVIAQLLEQNFVLWADAGIGERLSHVHALAQLGVRHIIAGLESLTGPDQLRQLVDIHGKPRLVFSLDLRDGRPLASDSWNRTEPWDVADTAMRLGVERILVLDLAAVGAGTLRDSNESPTLAQAAGELFVLARRASEGPSSSKPIPRLRVGLTDERFNRRAEPRERSELTHSDPLRGSARQAIELCERLRSAHPALEISTGGGVRDVNDLRHLRQIGVNNVLVASALHDGRLTADDLNECQR